jgi:stress-induced morphogen
MRSSPGGARTADRGELNLRRLLRWRPSAGRDKDANVGCLAAGGGQRRQAIRSTKMDGRAMAMVANDIERLIRAHIPDAQVTIRDLAGDGDHYQATVIAESFRGKSRVQQHQIVYEALKAELGGKLHALALQTGTPD